MSKEVMAECLEEANEILGAFVHREEGEERRWPVFTSDVVTIAVALYQERMRGTHRRGFPLGAGYGDTNLGTGRVK